MPVMRSILAGLALLLAGAQACAQEHAKPLLPSGPDPWVTQRDGVYYYTSTSGDRIELRKTRDLHRLADAAPIVVWRPAPSGAHSISIWAPELHYLDGKWYLYYTAAEKGHDDDAHRHVFVLENASPDPRAAAGSTRAGSTRACPASTAPCSNTAARATSSTPPTWATTAIW